jgi:hypothetical protein
MLSKNASRKGLNHSIKKSTDNHANDLNQTELTEPISKVKIEENEEVEN